MRRGTGWTEEENIAWHGATVEQKLL
jgi:hypothetical protein